jgi:MFS family permease
MVTGFYYSLVYGIAILFAGSISDKYPRRILLIIFGACWSLTSFGNMCAVNFQMILCMRMLFALFSAF